MIFGIIEHSVSFLQPIWKSALWRQTIQGYLPFNYSVGNINTGKWSYIKQVVKKQIIGILVKLYIVFCGPFLKNKTKQTKTKQQNKTKQKQRQKRPHHFTQLFLQTTLFQ